MGFTYGLDRSGETGRLMMRSALDFSRTMERWFGKIDWDSMLLDKGYYLLHKTESLLQEDELVAYYDDLQRYYTSILDSESSYFGKRPKKIFEVLPTIPDGVSPKLVSRVIKTEERIVEMFKFRDVIVENVKKRNIKVLTDTEVVGVRHEGSKFAVDVITKNGDKEQLKGDVVVNCLWNNRIAIDKTIGLDTVEDPLYRFKIGIFGKVSTPVLNCSIISGAFGNISPRMDNDYAYISWHTDCMQGMTTDGVTPKEWEAYFAKDQSKELTAKWVSDAVRHISEFVPAAATFKPIKLLPGVICSAGKTDIGDKTSAVHRRACQMGIYGSDGYFSVNTGKFSSAPLLAVELLNKIES
jgi:hypothetical protein